jgi:putative acetyltransferase
MRDTRNASHLSPFTSHLSRLTSHLSPLTSHLSPLTSHFCFILQISAPFTKKGAFLYFYNMNDVMIRNIQPSDNPFLAKIVKDTLAEFGANHPNTVYYDPTTDALYELFQKEGAAYYVAELNGEIIGGGGIYPTDALPAGTCELVKMYLLPQARGLGLGRTLIEKSLEFAQQAGYKQVYLESMPELKQALTIYARFGFEYLKGPMGNSGHTGCSLWMLKSLEES